MPKKPPGETPLYVRLPAQASDKLERAAAALGMPKKALVAHLVSTYLDAEDPRGRAALGELGGPRSMLPRPSDGVTLGSYSFRAYEPPEVLNAAQAGDVLQLDEATIVTLAEDGVLPGRKLGAVWRFSRAALLAWLGAPEKG